MNIPRTIALTLSVLFITTMSMAQSGPQLNHDPATVKFVTFDRWLMMQQLLLAMMVIAMFGVSAVGQTPTDLQRKYGILTNVFEVRPGVLMTVKYGDDGQVSEMVIEKRHTTDRGINLNAALPEALVKELIDELAPIETRGKRIDKGYKDKWYLESNISGNLTETNRRYENFTITLIGTLSPAGEGSGTIVLIIKRNTPGKVASTTR